jgi:hypothetical protein
MASIGDVFRNSSVERSPPQATVVNITSVGRTVNPAQQSRVSWPALAFGGRRNSPRESKVFNTRVHFFVEDDLFRDGAQPGLLSPDLASAVPSGY